RGTGRRVQAGGGARGVLTRAGAFRVCCRSRRATSPGRGRVPRPAAIRGGRVSAVVRAVNAAVTRGWAGTDTEPPAIHRCYSQSHSPVRFQEEIPCAWFVL